MSINDCSASAWDRACKFYDCRPKVETNYAKKSRLKEAADFYFQVYEEDIKRENDVVNKPSHYTQGGIECIDYIKQVTGDGFIGYLQGNITKYLHRWRDKNGIEDLKKAQWYLNQLIHYEEHNNG